VGRNLAKSGRVLHDVAEVRDGMQISERPLLLRSEEAGAADGGRQSRNWPRISTNRP